MGVYITEFADATDGGSALAERSRSGRCWGRLSHSFAEDMNHFRQLDLFLFQNLQIKSLVWSGKASQINGLSAFALRCAEQASRTRVHHRTCSLRFAQTRLSRTTFIRPISMCLPKTLHPGSSQTGGSRALHVRCAAGASGQAGILDWLRRELNEEQFEAVTAPTDIPVLVMAGPGSGKTRVLTFRMAYLIAQGLVHPSRLLAVTFTNKAAEEMKERVMGLLAAIQCSLDTDSRSGPLVGTIHSACVRMLYQYGAARDIPSDFIIYTDLESKRVIRDLLLARNSEVPMDKKIAQLNSLLSELKNEAFCAECGDAPMLDVPVVSSSAGFTMDFVREARELLPDYQQRLKRAGALDFDDLILEAGRLLRDHPSIRSELQRRWEYLLVDETQDTSRAQYHVLRLLAERERGGEKLFPVFLVGDPDQSIYGWRGADTSAIRRFRDSFPRTRVCLLETNYRSTESVARFAQFIIEQDQMRVEPGKRMRTVQGLYKPVRVVHCENSKAEAEFVVQQARSLMETHNLSGQDIAVMYRTNALSREFEEACIRAGMPYALIGGLPFYERREIKDILACLKLLHNEDDAESFKRVLGFAVTGVGPRTTETFLQWAQTQHCSPFAALRLLRERDERQTTSVPAASEGHVNSEAKTEPTRGDVTAVAMVATTESIAVGGNTSSDQNATIPIRSDKRRLLLSFLQMFEEWKRLLESSVSHERRGPSILAHVIEGILKDTRYEQHLRKLAPHGRNADEEASTDRCSGATGKYSGACASSIRCGRELAKVRRPIRMARTGCFFARSRSRSRHDGRGKKLRKRS
ncbi:hypothetical protein F1559_001633 [Cyanidiococcus yangmingshanensis]|uniref:DNA 3'-5' helicase n=1 Tax=Cyanidiococcus yangmingshanensis TaxID=2690220 RepID=A0A7J7IIM7_9RHOD|nr:hypothetical protein F1559_001633 [Cyanidiococcus yangmingshanensis]